MRVFAALPLPAAAAAGLAAAVEPLRRAYPRLRWVLPAAYHLTVHFFGELADGAVAQLTALMADPGLRVPAIHAGWGGPGQFPERGHARVLHASLGEGAAGARAFHDLFHRLALPLGWSPEARGFSPHVTFARVASDGPAEGWEAGVQLPRDGFVIAECILFQSVRGPSGARYVALASARFDAPPGGEGSTG
jgi:RNA 2',3'-cyclic 3'-phosphodiesterase